jgi:hypothetical protein
MYYTQFSFLYIYLPSCGDKLMYNIHHYVYLVEVHYVYATEYTQKGQNTHERKIK